jgi:phosphoribosylformylglycinamidine cyclo-ligase
MKLLGEVQPKTEIHALSHITGGGIVGNTSRVLPKDLMLDIDWAAWSRPPIFDLIKRMGNVPEDDMRRAFNLGVGLVIISEKSAAGNVLQALRKAGESPFVMGAVAPQ